MGYNKSVGEELRATTGFAEPLDQVEGELVDCYLKYHDSEGSNIQIQEIQYLQRVQKCQERTDLSVEEKYECMGKSTESPEFCLDQYKVDSDQAKMEKCLHKNK